MRIIFRDLLKITVFVLIIYTPVFLISVFSDFSKLEDNINISRMEHLRQLKGVIQKLLLDDRMTEACQRLAAEQMAYNIQTYTVTSASEGECSYPIGMKLPPIDKKDYGAIKEFEVNKVHLFFLRENAKDQSKDIAKEFEWAISAARKTVNLSERLASEHSQIIIESIVQSFISIIYIVFAFAFLAVLILAKSIQNQYRKDGKDPVWFRFLYRAFGWLQLDDMQIVQSATKAMLKRNEGLIKDQDLLETSLEYSILNEIKTNNHKMPYSFQGTVAKVDINGYSKAVSAGRPGESHSLTKALEDFGCELLQRYQGLFEKTVGDEIVVVFKSEDSALQAVAFCRDLMREFSELEFNFQYDSQNEKRRFTLKSAISSSPIIFGKRAPGYGFLGDSLTYSTRLLEVVTIKDRNILSCLQSQVSKIPELVKVPDELRRFEFKNMTASEGYLIDTFTHLEEIYEKSPHLIKYFKSNTAIVYLLERIRTENDFERIHHVLTTFNDSGIRNTTPQVIAAWIETLVEFEKRVYQNPKMAFSFSRFIVEGARLIPTHQWNAACTEAIVSISRYIEGRINASVVDVLIEKDLNLIAVEQEKSFILENDQSFRTRGNLLINQAIFRLSNDILEKIFKMIQSKNPLESSTGIYCACRVIIHYRKKSPAELETFISYRKLSKLLHGLYLEKHKEISPRLLKLIDQVNSYNEMTFNADVL